MPRKDFDVWDPPEDRKSVEEPPSVFLQHFEGRAVRVGKDGSNAQLVRVKNVKPIRWSQNNDKHIKNSSGVNNNNNNNKRQEGLLALPLGGDLHKGNILKKNNGRDIYNYNNTGVIMAPDELKEIISLQLRQQQKQKQEKLNNFGNGLCNSDLISAQVVEQKDLHQSTTNVVELSSSEEHDGQVKLSSELNSTESSKDFKTLELFPFTRLSANERRRNAQKADGLKKPLAQLMPKSLAAAAPKPVSGHIEQPSTTSSNKNKKTTYDDQNNNDLTNIIKENYVKKNNVSSELDVYNDFCSCVSFLSGSEDDFAVDNVKNVPLYQPTGLLFLGQAGVAKISKKRVKKPLVKNRSSLTSAGRGGNVCKAPLTNNTRVEERMSNSLPMPRKAAVPPARLEPLPSQPPRRLLGTPENCDCGASPSPTNNDEQEPGKAKKNAYKAYNLKDYKIMMEQVANLKLGGLGPIDTEERRQAKERMERQRQYGELVEKQAAEKIREKQQQRLLIFQQRRDAEDGAPAQTAAPEVNVAKVRQQPPPPERVQAQERRARALEYARNLPRLEPLSARRNHKENGDYSDNNDDDELLFCREDEAAWRRGKRLNELEAKHRSDRDRVEAVKRQLGY